MGGIVVDNEVKGFFWPFGIGFNNDFQELKEPCWRCLFLATRTAVIYNPVIKAYIARLIHEEGKHYFQAITAVMRKLIIHLNIIVKNLDYELLRDTVALNHPLPVVVRGH